MVLFLFRGLHYYSGLEYFVPTAFYLLVFTVTYFLLRLEKPQIFIKSKVDLIYSKISFLNEHTCNLLANWLLIVSIATIVGHIAYLGELPFVKAMFNFNYFEITWIRRNITLDKPAIWNYGTNFILKAIFPVLMLYYFVAKKYRLLIVLTVFSVFYALCTMQKSYFVTVFIPIIAFALFSKKIFTFILFSLISACCIAFLVIITNPTMKLAFVPKEKKENAIKEMAESPYGAMPTESQIVEEAESESSSISFKVPKKIAKTVYKRLVLVPGEMVTIWYRFIPDKLPYLNGDGYRILANLKGHEYHEYVMELYPYAREKHAKLGFVGSLNVASFMYDYANFGYLGLFYSAIFLAICFICMQSFFQNPMYRFSLNIFYVLMLSSSAISTLLFSGGWGLVLILFILLKEGFESGYEKNA